MRIPFFSLGVSALLIPESLLLGFPVISGRTSYTKCLESFLKPVLGWLLINLLILLHRKGFFAVRSDSETVS